MALRLKTVEYPFATRVTELASNTLHTFTAITLDIPEITTRTFKSVVLEVTFRSSETVAADITFREASLKLGAAAFDGHSLTETLLNTGTHTSHVFLHDLTTYFGVNFGAGASQTSQATFKVTGVASINITAKVIVTYQYDDASATTRVKTVKIPLDTVVGVLPNALTEVGTNQVPLLDTILPESTKSYKQMWFEIEGVECSADTTDFMLGLSLDAEAEANDGNHRANLTPKTWYRFIWVRNDMVTSALHAFKMRTTVATKFLHPSITLCVTYTYDHSASTNIFNSLWMPIIGELGRVGGITVGEKSGIIHKFLVEEPSILSLQQSGIQLYFQGDTSNLVVAVGTQGGKTYTHSGGLLDGGVTLSHRVDGGSANGSGMTISRGEVSLSVGVRRGGATAGQSLSGMAYINYTSTKHASGDGVHGHSVYFNAQQTLLMAVEKESVMALALAETNYEVKALGYHFYYEHALTAGITSLKAGALTGEANQNNWVDLNGVGLWGSAKRTTLATVVRMSDVFRRWAQDSFLGRLNPKSTRPFRTESPVAITMHGGIWVCYGSIIYTVAGVLKGFTGDGSGIMVDIFKTSTKEKANEAVSVVGGGYTAVWYDNTGTVFAVAKSGTTRKGRSDDNTAV